MKAVILLLCLALARANIFQRRHHNQMERFVMQPSAYINQYEQYPYQQVRVTEELPWQVVRTTQDKQQAKHQDTRTSGETINRYDDSFESDERIREPTTYTKSIENVELYAAPLFADKKTPVTFRSEKEPVQYGDVISWKGIKMATGSNAIVKNQKDIEKIFAEAQKATKHIEDPETKAKLHQALEVAYQNEDEDAHLNATQLLKKYQYPVEEYTIKTEDGYYLTLFRILPRKQPRDVTQRPVVFLMHSLLGSADDWLLMGPGKSLAYLLCDAGYDVWLGNARTTRYTRHVNKHPVLSDFWQFSNDEIALYDLPAMIDFVLETTHQKKMFYVGHSLGTTAFFALAAARPEYNDKIAMMYALSPMVYMSYVRSPMVRMIALRQHIRGQFRPSKEVVDTYGGAMCQNEIDCDHLCSNVYVVMNGITVQDMNVSLIPSILRHLPAGGSAGQMLQYAQSYNTRDFRMYDYGPVINQVVYEQILPPKYPVEKVTAPVTLYYSEHDWLAHPKDVERLRQELPNVSEAYMIPEEYFGSMSYLFSKKAPEVVYKRLIDSIEKHYPY